MNMDIASLSMHIAEDRLADQVGAKVLSMALKTQEGAGATLLTTLASTETASDPALGSRLDAWA